MKSPDGWMVCRNRIIILTILSLICTAFRGELTSHHPHFHPDSPAVCHDVDLRTAQGILPDGFTVGLHMGTWHKPGEEYDAKKIHDSIKYSAEDDEAIDNWISGNHYSERQT